MAASRHIAFVCTRLDLPGGIERAIVNTANLFVQNGLNVSLIILDETAASFYPVDKKIKIIQHNLDFGITEKGNTLTRKLRLLKDIRLFKKIITQNDFDTVITTDYVFSIAAVMAGIYKKTKLLSWEHHHFYELSKSLFWNKMFDRCYPKLNGIVCLNADEKKLFAAINKNSFVIPNFIETENSPSQLASRQILTIGRLTAVKGTDLLLPIAKQVLENNPDWTWKLIGDGYMKELAENFIAKENLQGKLIIAAPQTWNINHEYQQAALYVMTSRNECFPMTLLEAMSNGLPCIAFDCDTGPRHIIQQNKNGVLVTALQQQEMISTINSLISDETLRKKMSENAFDSVKQFSPGNIFDLWKTVL